MDWNKLLSTKRIRELAGGRPSEKPSSESRAEIHRDYGRAVFSTPVRRLQDKAQVFPLEPIDAVRTRLTHSLEVSSTARGLANGVGQRLVANSQISASQAYDIETIAATCGLVHDIGNPPFGHFGETATRGWFDTKFSSSSPDDELLSFENGRLKKDLLCFEGNAQTIRLLSKLQVLSDAYGLNLTAATFSALLKYTANSHEVGTPDRQSKKKLGYFTSEQPAVDLVRDETGTKDARNPIAFLVEASDDIVYSVIDIEDGIKKGVITWSDVVKELEAKKDDYGLRIAQRAEGLIKRSSLLSSLKSTSFDEGAAQYFRTFLMSNASAAVQKRFVDVYDEIMNGDYDKEILYDSEAGVTYDLLKKLAARSVYSSKQVLRLELLGHQVIHSLLGIFSRCKQSTKTKTFEEKAYSLMSQNYRAIHENPDEWEKSLPPEYRRSLLVTDFICGMTDSYALKFHQELTNG